MAKPFARKWAGGKRRSVKKTAGARVAKRSSTLPSPELKRVKRVVACEVRKALNSGAHNEKRKVTMELIIDENQVFVNGKAALRNCIRIPITDAIPSQQCSGHSPDARTRRANKIVVTGVSVRLALSGSRETRVMMVLYEPHESVRACLNKVPLETVPDAKLGNEPETFRTVMAPFQDLGLVSKHGPLMTKKFGGGVALDSLDDTPYGSRRSTHGSKPIGSVFRRKIGGEGLRITQNWNQGGKAEMLRPGYTAWPPLHTLEKEWKLNRECTYVYEGMNRQVCERGLEVFVYIDCPSWEPREVPEDSPRLGAVIHKLVVDVSFHGK